MQMAKRGPKLKFPEGFTTIQVDNSTYDRLREISAREGVKLSQLLREFSKGYYQENADQGDIEIDRLFAAGETELGIANLGEMPTSFDMVSIDNALKENPNVTTVGYYDKNDNGNWIFNFDRYYKDNPDEK